MTDPSAFDTASALTIEDLHAAAVRRLPEPIRQYVDGGSDDELTLRANEVAWQGFTLHPRSLIDVSTVTTRSTAAETEVAAPIGLAPTGYTRLLHPAGELAVAEAAASRSLPYVLSTVSSTTMEEVAAAGPPPWFQLYVLKDRGRTRDLVKRARAIGSPALMVTIDTQAPGHRLRDLRTGFSFPPGVGGVEVDGSSPGETGDVFADDLTWDDLAAIREWWGDRPILLKGPVGAVDAARAMTAGASGIHLSNHGGRQLDRTFAMADLIEEIREAIGLATLTVDGGIRSGLDAAIAIARGADAVFVGRPYLWGLAAAGRAGVERALDLLVEELTRTMRLLGVRTIEELRLHGTDLTRRRGS